MIETLRNLASETNSHSLSALRVTSTFSYDSFLLFFKLEFNFLPLGGDQEEISQNEMIALPSVFRTRMKTSTTGENDREQKARILSIRK